MRGPVCVGILVGVCALAQPTFAGPQSLPGWSLYDRLCVACHGAAGDGQGPAAPFTWGRPRSLTAGTFAWRSTPIGSPPTTADLRTTIAYGAPGTSMPGFALAPDQLDQLVAVVQAFAPSTFARTADDVVVSLGPSPAVDPGRGARLWTKLGCASCHGARGAGDGVAMRALATAPYDLTTRPLRRPRAGDDPATRRRAAATSIATGLAGTAMPGYAGTIPNADLWALADHVIAIGARTSDAPRTALTAAAITDDRATRLVVGTWPGHGDPDMARIFGGPVPAQGAPPASLAPAQASLSARQCARCHAKQHREWRGSLHGAAASPGLIAQVEHALSPTKAASCQRCHTPLAEQRTDPALRAEGVQCAGCHVREWTRHGPPGVSPSLIPIAGYPLRTLSGYERSDFCLPCHQLPPRTAVAGRPLLDTYREWLEGPYQRRGVQCQHCHMPNREHTFRGIHDPETFRQAIKLDATAFARDATVSVIADVTNIGAGHYLPTTPTPAVWLRIELLDAAGTVVPGATATHRIGRDIYYDGTWHERADTRIAPGERRRVARAWTTHRATAARITLEVQPDEFYERLYQHRMRGTLAPAARALYVQALAHARTTGYVAEQRIVAVTRR